jgi:alanine racemase
MKNRPNSYTLAEINLGNITHNIKEIKKLLNDDVKFMAVVKADAYGHGSVQVSKHIRDNVDHLSVATIQEALEIRSAGIKKPVMILSETSPLNAKEVVRNDLVQTVYTYELASALSKAAISLRKKVKAHFKVDTGMGRIGASVQDAAKIFNEISSLKNLQIEGIFTHLARAEEKNGFTSEQLNKFNSVLKGISSDHLIKHAANSAGAIYHKDSHMDMVRIGLTMYGLYPPTGDKDGISLKPALEFKTCVVYLKRVPKGTPVSYGSTYITEKETSIATLPVGYADGLPRALSNKGSVLIGGKKYPIVGRVCMDLTMVDVGDSSVKIGDEVALIGAQGNERISADDIASIAGTISYEIVCGIGKRVPRIYKK